MVKTVCPECGSVMVPCHSSLPAGIRCPECGWGWTTAFIDPVLQEPAVCLSSRSQSSGVSADRIRTGSRSAGDSFLQTRRLFDAPAARLYPVPPQAGDTAETPGVREIRDSIAPESPYGD